MPHMKYEGSIGFVAKFGILRVLPIQVFTKNGEMKVFFLCRVIGITHPHFDLKRSFVKMKVLFSEFYRRTNLFF
jgi:hypothetical protein